MSTIRGVCYREVSTIRGVCYREVSTIRGVCYREVSTIRGVCYRRFPLLGEFVIERCPLLGEFVIERCPLLEEFVIERCSLLGEFVSTILDVRVFHPNAPSYRSKSLGALYKQHENAKKREYSARIREVERGVFTPLVLSTAGGMARECTTFFRRLADSLASKRDVPYSTIMGWLRCRISFALLRSAIRAIRGSRSSINSFVPVDIDEVSKECAIH